MVARIRRWTGALIAAGLMTLYDVWRTCRLARTVQPLRACTLDDSRAWVELASGHRDVDVRICASIRPRGWRGSIGEDYSGSVPLILAFPSVCPMRHSAPDSRRREHTGISHIVLSLLCQERKERERERERERDLRYSHSCNFLPTLSYSTYIARCIIPLHPAYIITDE